MFLPSQQPINEVLPIRSVAESRFGMHPPPVNIGQKILNDIGRNKIRRDGGDFLDLLSNAKELKENKHYKGSKKFGLNRQGGSTLRSISQFKKYNDKVLLLP